MWKVFRSGWSPMPPDLSWLEPLRRMTLTIVTWARFCVTALQTRLQNVLKIDLPDFE